MSDNRVLGKLGLIMVVVSDMERSVAFYRDVVGLKLLFKQSNWSQFEAGNIILGLHPIGDEVKVGPTTGCTFGIYVTDMQKAVAEIRLRGGQLAVEPRREPFGLWALLKDPDGYNVQIIQMAQTIDSQENIT